MIAGRWEDVRDLKIEAQGGARFKAQWVTLKARYHVFFSWRAGQRPTLAEPIIYSSSLSDPYARTRKLKTEVIHNELLISKMMLEIGRPGIMEQVPQ